MSLTLGAAALAVPFAGPAVAAAPGDSPLTLYTADEVVAYAYEGRNGYEVYTDLGLRLIAPTDAFEVWAHRPSYDDAVSAEWSSGNGSAQPLEPAMMTDFSGLQDFLTVRVVRVKTGVETATWQQDACLNGMSQRVSPDAPARTPYPGFCPWNPYTVGSVMGIQGGHASTLMNFYQDPLSLAPGKYDVTSTINEAYTDLFGINTEDASGTTRLVVLRDPYGSGGRTRPPAQVRTTQAHASEPARAQVGAPVDGIAPDLESLPAFGMNLNRKGTVLRFAATVWNGGNSPLVVDGFRRDGEDVMDAYQYFYDADGTETGHEAVGQMQWHAANHNHWHFEDFARYRLLNEDMSEAVLSTKQSFCLANTDAVDYTVPNADWHPENTDLSTACGGFDALSVREVLSSGSGDTYAQYRAGQAFRIKNIPNGTYWVAVEANPLRNLVELDDTNNNSYRQITLKGGPDHRRLVIAQVGIIEETLPDWM